MPTKSWSKIFELITILLKILEAVDTLVGEAVQKNNHDFIEGDFFSIIYICVQKFSMDCEVIWADLVNGSPSSWRVNFISKKYKPFFMTGACLIENKQISKVKVQKIEFVLCFSSDFKV